MKKINYISGQVVNKFGITYIKETLSIIYSKVKRRVAVFKCECGKEFTSTIRDVVFNKRKSCGCKKGALPNFYKQGDLINNVEFIKTCGTNKHAQSAIFKCPICCKEWKSLVANIQAGNTKSCCGKKRGWSKSQWINFSKTSKLYKVRLYNEKESFIKIGITTKTIKQRFKKIPYKVETIKIIEGESG
jgi:hypothetical protein